MKQVNISLEHHSGDIEIQGLNHAIEYLDALFFQNGWMVSRSSNSIAPEILNIVFGAHTNPKKFISPLGNVIIFNTEQLHAESRWTNALYLDVLNKNIIWDYSASNLDFIDHDRKSIIHFLYCPTLSSRVAIKSCDKAYDLLFYGLMNDRRQKIIDRLQAQNLRVKCLFGVYGGELDFYLSQTRAVLNLHYYEKHFFQSIRAFYPLSNGIPVISENYDIGSAHPIYKEVIFTPQEKKLDDYTFQLFQGNELESLFAKKLEIYKHNSAQVNIDWVF
jgi:hypothetical protein